MYNEWIETKNQFRTGLVISSIIVFALLIWPGNKIDTSETKFTTETVVLSSKPIFKNEQHGKSGTDYFVNLNFVGDNINYKIGGIDYEFLHYEEFVKNIKTGDTLIIKKESNQIHSLSKNGIDYLNYKEAETNRGLSIFFVGYLFIPIAIVCLIVQFFSERPSFSFKDKQYKVQFDIITFIIIFVTIIILLYIMPEFQIIENGTFVEQN
ncbi:hypothetical protein [Flavobacterium psychrophilum]|uniref:hypothetical protein n=1 Tax=Flavobacterium psychrophilum TaxID=96345 RepID=UPI000B7C2277|nr:hypothetical protein [Flavobacterium psychrophilum]SNB36354.1 membrane hypothetical protein [Flavobacterium psychrophilum]